LQLHLEEHVSYFFKLHPCSSLGEIVEMHSAVFNDIDSDKLLRFGLHIIRFLTIITDSYR